MNINIPLWLPLLALFLACLVWHITENRQLTSYWQKHLDAPTAKSLKRFAWSRTVQFLLALLSCVLIIFLYATQLNKSETDKAQMGEMISALEQKNSTLTAKANEAPPPVVITKLIPEKPAEPAVSPDTPDTVDSVYNPEEITNDKQSKMDAIKKRYEDILVTYFFLRKCEKNNPSDYHVIISALSQEMASINAPGRLQNDILTSAQGSYKEMYSTSTCSADNVATTYAQYSSYIEKLTKEYVPQ